MLNQLKKHWLAFLLVGCVAAVAFAAAYTKFTYLEVKNDLLVDNTSTFTGVATFNGATTMAAPTFTGPVLPYARTLAQINSLTSGTTNQIVVCSDCVMSHICISSGTTAGGQWTVPTATAPATTGAVPLHCQ